MVRAGRILSEVKGEYLEQLHVAWRHKSNPAKAAIFLICRACGKLLQPSESLGEPFQLALTSAVNCGLKQSHRSYGTSSMAENEAYMLKRDSEESRRLDIQHEYMRDLGHGHLIHPLVNTDNIRAIADVGTGTGLWLREIAHELTESTPNSGTIEFVGFDVSSLQFRGSSLPNVHFVVHDIVMPIPQEYQEKFDLVHIRCLSYALKAEDLASAVQNAASMIRQ